MWGVLLKHPVLASFFCGEFLLHIPCWHLFFFFFFSVSFSSTSRGGMSLTHPMLGSFLSGCFSYTSRACFFFYLGSFSCNPVLIFLFLFWRVSLTHPLLTSFLCGEFLLQIPCWLLFFFFLFYLGSFSYTSHVGFTFLWGVSLTQPVLAFFLFLFFFLFFNLGHISFTLLLASFLFSEFILNIPCSLKFLCGEPLLHIP